MTDNTVVGTLNSLLAAEHRYRVPPQVEDTAFVPQGFAHELVRLREFARASEENIITLTELVLSLDGAPHPPPKAPHSAELYFQDVRYLMPRVIRNYRKLLGVYRAALPALHGEPRAAQLASSIMLRYEALLNRSAVSSSL